MNRKGVELSINTIVIVILVLIVLIVVLFIFSGAMRDFASNILAKLKTATGLWNATQSQLQP